MKKNKQKDVVKQLKSCFDIVKYFVLDELFICKH